MTTLSQTSSPNDENGADEIVKDPSRIASILDELNRRLVLVGVQLNPNGPLFDGTLVRLDKANSRLYLGEFNCVDLKRQIDPRDKIQVFASLRGIAVRFTLIADAILYEEDAPVCVASYPDEITYLQRRESFRVQLPLYDRRSIRIRQKSSGTELRAILVDLSSKGFCLELEATAIDESQMGDVFGYSDMELPEIRHALSGEVQLVNLRASQRAGCTLAGFAFLEMNPQSERHLMRAALYYQREARKKGI